MSNTQQLDNDVLMSAVLFANKCIGVEFAQYQLALATDVLHGNYVLVSLRWCDHVRAYYHGALLCDKMTKQQQSGQVPTSSTDSVLPTADDFLAAWAPKFGVTVGGRAETAAQLVQTMVAPVLAAKDAQIVDLQVKLNKSEQMGVINEPIGQQFVEFIEKRLGEFGFTIKRPDSIHWGIIDDVANCWLDMIGNADRAEMQRTFGVELAMERDAARAKVADLEKQLAVETNHVGRLLAENKAAEKALEQLTEERDKARSDVKSRDKRALTMSGRIGEAHSALSDFGVPYIISDGKDGHRLGSLIDRIQVLANMFIAPEPTPTEDDEVKYATASLLDESKFIGHYMNMSRKGLVAAVLNLSHDVNVIASQRDRTMNIPSACEALNAVHNRVINELDNKRDDVGHYRVREVDVVKIIDEAIGAPWWANSDKGSASTKLIRDLYKQLVDEDLAWLSKQPQALERNHIEAIVRASVDAEYPYARAATAPPCGPCQGSGKLWCSSWDRQKVCAFCNGSGRQRIVDDSKQPLGKYDVIEKDPAKRAELVAACLNERGVLHGHGHPEARTEFVNGHHMVRFTARMSSIVDMIEQNALSITKLALEIEESDEAYRRGRDLMQQVRK